MTFGAAARMIAMVGLAAGGCGGASDDTARTSLSEERASLAVSPVLATPPQTTRITLRITTKKRERFVSLLIHPGRSACGRTWIDEVERWPEPVGESVREDYVGPGRATITVSGWYSQPGSYRVCGYFDDDLAAAATFAVRPLNRVIRPGHGVGQWQINERFVLRAGFLGQLHPEKKPPRSCPRSFWDAERVDIYTDHITVAWEGGVLAAVRTLLHGDRSPDGFVIGKTKLGTVRARHRQSRLQDEVDAFSGGTARTLVVSSPTAAGKADIRYRFDSRGVLDALETSMRRC